MKHIHVFDVKLHTAVLRFYLMIGATLLIGLTGTWWLAAICGFTIALSFILAVRFEGSDAGATESKTEVRTLGHRPLRKTA